MSPHNIVKTLLVVATLLALSSIMLALPVTAGTPGAFSDPVDDGYGPPLEQTTLDVYRGLAALPPDRKSGPLLSVLSAASRTGKTGEGIVAGLPPATPGSTGSCLAATFDGGCRLRC